MNTHRADLIREIELQLISAILDCKEPKHARSARWRRDILQQILKVENAEDFSFAMSGLAFATAYCIMLNGKREGYQHIIHAFQEQVRDVILQALTAEAEAEADERQT